MDFRNQLFKAQGMTKDMQALLSSFKSLEEQDIFLDIQVKGEEFHFEFDYRDFSEIICLLMSNSSKPKARIFFQDDETCSLSIQRP